MLLIALGVGLLGIIGFAIIFAGMAVLISAIVAISLISFLILSAVLGEQYAGLSLFLCVPIGVIGAITLFSRGGDK